MGCAGFSSQRSRFNQGVLDRLARRDFDSYIERVPNFLLEFRNAHVNTYGPSKTQNGRRESLSKPQYFFHDGICTGICFKRPVNSIVFP